MTTVRLTAVVTEDHKLTVKVPNEIPPGRVEVLIQQSETASSVPANPAREAARAKLAAAGLLSAAHRLPPGIAIPTDAQVQAAGVLPPGARPSEDVISEDRNET